MTAYDWSWRVIERINLSDAPHDDWEALYHWLNESVSNGEVVLRINEDLEFVAYICEVVGQ